jgi:hypothetical protein
MRAIFIVAFLAIACLGKADAMKLRRSGLLLE